ncbi:hypothetical protein AGMMS4956_12290 [Bacteroidia bacterium]|nr:hypothetical protein AGMMS4956_12290 [Bacteroidia bacterium]
MSLFFSLTAIAQYVSYGNDPSRVRWQHIQNQYFDVIFADSSSEQGKQVFRLLQRLRLPVLQSLGNEPRKIPIVLHPHTGISNGWVIWAPRRVELLTTPPSETYPQLWLTQLVLHEYRHVVQTSRLNVGFTRGLSFVLGEQALAIPSALTDMWLFEGDAVAAETALSCSGRGRMPSFGIGLKPIVQREKKYSISKIFLGSYKNFVPNHYVFGYEMVAYGRYRYGKSLWANVFSYIGKYPFLLFPQTLAVKKYTGQYTAGLYRETQTFLDSLYKHNDTAALSHLQQLPTEKKREQKEYVSYENFAVDEQQNLWAQKTSLARSPRLVRIDSNATTSQVSLLGNVSSRFFYHRNRLFWTEYSPSIRWEQQGFSDVWRYDVAAQQKQQITHKKRFFSPAANEKNELAVVQKNSHGVQSILLIDSSLQTIKTLVQLPFLQEINDLAWLNHHQLAILTTTHNGIGIELYDVRTQQFSTLLSPVSFEISGLAARGDTLFFSSGYNGINNLYALQAATRQAYQLTQVRYGAFAPRVAANGAVLYFAHYTEHGYKLAAMPMDSLLWQKTDFDAPAQMLLAEHLAQQEQFVADTATLDTAYIAAQAYARAKHLFRFHSWLPAAVHADENIASNLLHNSQWGITLLSQNNLSTAFTQLRYAYDGFHKGSASFTYTGFFPVLSVSPYVEERNTNRLNSASTLPHKRVYGGANLTISVPLNFSKSYYYQGFTPYFQTSFDSEKRAIKNDGVGSYFLTNIGFRYYWQTRMAHRDLHPQWGVELWGNVMNLPLQNVWNKMATISAAAYLPGIAANHSLRVMAGAEWQQMATWLYATRLQAPRGLVKYAGLAAQQITAGTVGYEFPLLLPDWEIGALCYIKRLRLNVFADAMIFPKTFAQQEVWRKSLSSVGYEAMVDFHVFRLSYMLSAGVRQSFTFDNIQKQNATFVEMLFALQIQ